MRAEKKARKAVRKSLDRRRKCGQCAHNGKKNQLSHKGAACLPPRRGEVSRSDGEGPPCLSPRRGEVSRSDGEGPPCLPASGRGVAKRRRGAALPPRRGKNKSFRRILGVVRIRRAIFVYRPFSAGRGQAAAPTALSHIKLCFPPHPSRPLRETGRATFSSSKR